VPVVITHKAVHLESHPTDQVWKLFSEEWGVDWNDFRKCKARVLLV